METLHPSRSALLPMPAPGISHMGRGWVGCLEAVGEVAPPGLRPPWAPKAGWATLAALTWL